MNTCPSPHSQIKSVAPVPLKLQERPQWRGLPVPYIALIAEDGTPDFRAIDERTRRQVIAEELCQLCGQKLGRWKFFMGGPASAEANAYYEPAAHLECTIFAMQTCPFILGRIEHVEPEKVAAKHKKVAIHTVGGVLAARCPVWIIRKARAYTLVQGQDGAILVRPTFITAESGPIVPETMTAEDWRQIHSKLYLTA